MFKRRSVTLVELIIAIAITTIVAGAGTLSLWTSFRLEGKGRAQATLRRQADLALQWLERDIREASFFTFTGPTKLELFKTKDNQRIQYLFDQPQGVRTLRRCVVPDTNGQVLLSNLNSFGFTYRSLFGKLPTDDPANGIPLANISDLRLIQASFRQVSADDTVDSFTSVNVRVKTWPVCNKNLGKFYASITEALNEPLLGNNHTILVQAGTYYGSFTIPTSITLEGGYDQTFTRRNQKSVIDAQGAQSIFGSWTNRQTWSFNLDGFILRGAKGAAIQLSYPSRVTIRNCVITGNSQAISCGLYTDVLRLINCDITQNTSQNSTLIYCEPFYTGILEFINCSISNNTIINTANPPIPDGKLIYIAGPWWGGVPSSFRMLNSKVSGNVCLNFRERSAVVDIRASDMLIKDSSLNNNQLSVGNSAYRDIFRFSSGGAIRFNNCEIKDNLVSGTTFGESCHSCYIIGIGSRKFFMQRCDISSNETRKMFWMSGTFRVESGSMDELVLDRSRMENNILSDTYGYLPDAAMLKVNIGPGAASAASYYLKNILMSGNTFRCQGTWWGSPGRNLLNITSSANSPFSIINCTVANNTLFGVGGLMSFFSSPQANLQNNIVYFNNIDPYLNGKGKLFISYCDRDNTGIGNLTLDPRSGNNITDNPQFVDAAAGDFRLRPASPCINAGDPNPIYNDADGSRNDMGAYGGPAGQDIGFKAPTVDDPATPDIREDVIGTY